VTRPLVSIVTPSYNQAAFLADTLESVLAQDYPRIEYLVVDDGSTDGSVEIVERYADRLTWWARQENAGQVVALNRGFARASGELLGWINSDDTLLPGAVTTAVAALEANPDALLVYGDNVFIDERGDVVGPLPARAFDPPAMVRACDNHVPQPGALFRRRALDLAPLNERGYYFFDFEFVLQLSAHGAVVRIPQALGGYRLHPESKTAGAPLKKAADYLRVADEFFATRALPEHLRPHAAEGRATAYLRAAEYLYEGLDLPGARRRLFQALRVSPRRVLGSSGLLLKTLVPRSLVERLRRRRRAAAAA